MRRPLWSYGSGRAVPLPRLTHLLWALGLAGSAMLGAGLVLFAYGLFPSWFGVLPTSSCSAPRTGLAPLWSIAIGSLLLLGGVVAWALTLGQSVDPAARADPDREGRRFLLPRALPWAGSVVGLIVVLALIALLLLSSTGLTSAASQPYAVVTQTVTIASCLPASDRPAHTYSAPISVTAGLTTAFFGWSLANGSLAVPVAGLAAPSGACPSLPNGTGSWVLVLSSAQGTPLAAFGALGWAPLGSQTLPVSLVNGETIDVIATSSLASDLLTANGGSCGYDVTGSAEL